MDTNQLHSILSNDPFAKHHFIGVFPSDRLPKSVPAKCSLVVNLDKHNMPGSHWVSVYVNRSHCYIFDSFGTFPTCLKRWAKTLRGRQCVYNKVAHQRLDEITCGGYSVYVICELARGRRFVEIVRKFERQRYDDAFIRRYLASAHGVQIPVGF